MSSPPNSLPVRSLRSGVETFFLTLPAPAPSARTWLATPRPGFAALPPDGGSPQCAVLTAALASRVV